MRIAVERAFAPSLGPRKIGVELEMFLQAPPRCTPGYASYEPGGQLELSPPPKPTVPGALADIQSRLARLIEAGAVYTLTGVDPWRSLDEVPLALRTPRYLAMQALFDEYGEAGRRMMRLTASLQVCVDLLPGASGREQWLVANLAAPFLAAAYSGRQRTAIWRAMDPVRTGYDGRHLSAEDPVAAYTAFAAAAPRLPIPESFDDDYHLSTLFPPVRPRGGYLELRVLDSQVPTEKLLGTIWSLMYDAHVRRDALARLRPLLPYYDELWDIADPADLQRLLRPTEVAA